MIEIAKRFSVPGLSIRMSACRTPLHDSSDHSTSVVTHRTLPRVVWQQFDYHLLNLPPRGCFDPDSQTIEIEHLLLKRDSF